MMMMAFENGVVGMGHAMLGERDKKLHSLSTMHGLVGTRLDGHERR